MNQFAWMEGVSVFIAVLLITLLAAACDYMQENQVCVRNQALSGMQKCIVHRGGDGTTHRLPFSQLVVGDVIQLSGGDIVPADCWLFEEIDMVVDERHYFDGASDV